MTVGSVVLLLKDDEVPADAVVLDSGGIQGPTVYVETAAIDGETNLKIRLPCLPRENPLTLSGGIFDGAPSLLLGGGSEGANLTHEKSHVRVSMDKTSVSGLEKYEVLMHAEVPNGSIHRFNGSLEVIDVVRNARSDVTLSERNLCLRGSVIRASEWVLCMVVYTGRDTKLSMNSKAVPSKLSVVDSVVNRTLLIAIMTMVIVCVISTILNIGWEFGHER